MEEFDKDEIEALRKIAKERIAYDTITNKVKSSWIWIVGGGAVSIFIFWEKISAYFGMVK